MSGTELTKILFCVAVGLLAGFVLGLAVDPLPPQTALVAAGTKGADERLGEIKLLVDEMEKIADRQREAGERQQKHEEQEKRNRASGVPAGKEYVAARQAEKEVRKLVQKFAEVDRQLTAIRDQSDQYRQEIETHNEAKASPERRRHFILFGAGGGVIGLLVGLALLALDRGRQR